MTLSRAVAPLAMALVVAMGTAAAQPPASRVFGRVVDSQGNPVPGAEVQTLRAMHDALPAFVRRWTKWDEVISERQTVADELGKFMLEIEPWGEYALEASKGKDLRSRQLWPI